MKLLLDTHALLWWLDDPKLLSLAARQSISEPTNQVYVSLVTLWEIAIKRVLGKLTAPLDLEHDLPRLGFEPLSLEIRHIAMTESLPLHHRDPFDRLLVAQALVEGATLLTRDANIKLYNLAILQA